MTREEAIKQLDTMWKMLTSAYDDIADSHVAAYTMAVDALKAQGTCEDAVSRQTLQKELALYPIDDITSEDEAGYNRAINDVQKMVLHLPPVQTDVPDTNVGDNDLISRSNAIDAVDKLSDEPIGYLEAAIDALVDLPSAQPVIHCWECIYYDPEHIENKGVRYEYEDMPKDAFDINGTGLVSLEYGINVGGRCCRDYNVGYSEDKRVFVSKQNYCGRAERRTDG